MTFTEILVPDEQEGTKALVRSWLAKVGDWVAENDPLVELETDKVTQEIAAPASGFLDEILLDTDAEAEPGALLGRLRMGDAEGKGDEAPSSQCESGIGNGASEEPQRTAIDAANASDIVLSPSVRRAVAQYGIDPATISGTGRGGRITRADVDRAQAAREAAPPPPPTPTALAVQASDIAQDLLPAESAIASSAPSIGQGGVMTIPHDRMRLAIAQNMLRSVTAAPHVTAVFECDFSAIIAHRNREKAALERQGAKLTFTAYIVAACAAAMRVAPTVNSRWFDDRLEVYDDINVGIGTALGEKGLIVPVVERVQDLSLAGIAMRLSDLTNRARNNRLVAADVRGGTFTISNHGVSGSLMASPVIINQPQSAILGVGKLEKRVVVREVDGLDTIQIRPMCFVSLTIDHRVLDGHQTNSWLSKFVETIETWPA